VVNKFSQRMANSAYSEQQAKRFIISGIKGYEAAKQKAVKSGVRMHRSEKAGAEGRNMKKLLAKTSWYKKRDSGEAGEAESNSEPFDRFLISSTRRAQQESKAMPPCDTKIKKEVRRKAAPLTSVLFVEQTPGGVYAARLRETEEKLAPITNFRVKVVRSPGPPSSPYWLSLTPGRGGSVGGGDASPVKQELRVRNAGRGIYCKKIPARIVLGKGRKFKSKLWEEERAKFEAVKEKPETESCLEDMIAAREEGRKRKKEVLEINAGKRKKKEIWCGNHGEVPRCEAGSSKNGKEKRKFLYQGSPEKRKGSSRMGNHSWYH